MKLRVSHVAIPMRYRFGHARAARQVADNIVVEVVLSDGARGHGEAVPREYVTGESIDSVFGALTAAGPLPLRDGDDLATVARTLAELDLAARLGPERPALAAACALELAILDAHARREGRPLLDAAALVPAFASLLAPAPPATVTQTLTLGDELEAALERAGPLGGAFDVKLKVGLGDERDRARADAVRHRFGDAIDLRADANAAWQPAEAARALAVLAPFGLSSIEEPLAGRDLAGSAALRRAGARVMLDESVCSLDDGERAIAAEAADLFNLRLSKCGGLFGTLRLVDRARRAGVAWQLGCMVGETGLLSSLGRGFVARVAGARHFESTVPARSLEMDLTDAELGHRAGTRETPVPAGPGFGANVVPEAIERYTVASLALEKLER